ncbi:MAG: GNAT family N-acetyltransferase [Armatimonadetes bacterium]|nr:GNAT family N-acetyltransferase [Armatimonadota bacterium]MDE2205715.1 GNAT family N-acetyltransferase [Armatimonadota bacterium]
MERWFEPEPVALCGRRIRLEPMEIRHTADLAKAAGDYSVFRWYPVLVNSPALMGEYVQSALDEQARGVSVPFTTVEASSGEVIGSSRFMNIDVYHRRVEIGSTWLAPVRQRTGRNREAKYLMLQHAFEVWRVRRVELKTDARNEQSRLAMTRLGAVEEGTLRNHMVMPDGGARDTVYFSVIESEWPDLKARLEAELGRPPG